MVDSQTGATETTVAKKLRKSGSEKRRDQRVRTLRISDAQDVELVRNARAAGVSVSGFIRKRCCTAQDVKPRKIIPLEVQEVVRIRGLLGKLGGNLHQLVRRENFKENPHAEDYRQALAGVREAIAQCHDMLCDAHRKMAG